MAPDLSLKKISRRKFIKISAFTAGAALIPGISAIKAAAPTADLVLKNGKIITVDRKGSIVQALAVQQGRILDAGSNETIAGYIGHTTRVIDLMGKTLTPGLIDSHAHLPPFGLRESKRWVKLQGMESKDEILEALLRRAKNLPKGQWIVAWGVEDNALSYFTKEDLDKVSSDHPMLITHTTGQWGFANSLALKISGIDGNTQSPPGSKVAMQVFGKEPTGLLIHYPALYLVRKHMPAISDEDARECILHAANLYAREGVTTVHDNFFMVSEIGANQFAKAYINLVQTEALPTRIKIWPYLANLREATRVMDDIFSGKDPLPDSSVRDFFVIRKQQPGLFADLWGGLKFAIDGSGMTSLWYANPRALPLHSTADLQAMVKLGAINSRMNDFFDLWYLSSNYDFDGGILVAAIAATFEARGTVIPSQVTALSAGFADSPEKQAQWTSFRTKSRLEQAPESFAEVVAQIASFVGATLKAPATKELVQLKWRHPGPWA